ncbi:MAG: molybdenum cofactor biosynthesis protein MoaE [Archaeoglobaceae archaeon]|nr:molybdenum cofactor biosynthesis protein MoaE [Archaeoglobaceae archaeon]MCX8151578.1 molybdenum cofactor biosynthesis protein MoaE [Archaeoglobaceae archaeon]MDW8013144.1 molybdenum cofactor biosynthesis protein MoaE [Archaeoglobaceae archaeon]
MKIFIPSNEKIKIEVKKFGKLAEIRNKYRIFGESINISTEEMNLKEILELLCDLGFDFAALEDFDVETLEKDVGFKVPVVSKLEDVFKAPEVESLKSMIRKIKSSEFADECGAIGIFVGFVRKKSDGKIVKRMEYEAYEEILKEACEKIEKRLAKKSVIAKIYHKRGTIMPKEDIVYVLVMGRHRKDVWEPLMEAVEAMKSELPVWKKEVFNGETWVHDKR